ncbi:hypothetical protein [Aeromonas veronii]|uniref:hypothetical protein n=1 Tax=Aeromonas veronii TaxID=654 RepID=UPI003D1A279C
MEQLKNLADPRLVINCIYCGKLDSTREHIPSKVFLDKPYPENLSIIGACRECNNGFSKDEEFLACLIDTMVADSIAPSSIRRASIEKILNRSPALRRSIEAAKNAIRSNVLSHPSVERIERILIKLASGHSAYELATVCRNHPASIWWSPLELLNQEQQELFDAPEIVTLVGEIGSRNMQRMKVVEIKFMSQSGEYFCQQIVLNDWIEVQPQRYRYLVSNQDSLISIRIVIGEFLAAEIVWNS